MGMLRLSLGIALCAVLVSAGLGRAQEDVYLHRVFDNEKYMTVERPARDPSDKVNVSVTLTVTRVVNVETRGSDRILVLDCWIMQQWQDHRLEAPGWDEIKAKPLASMVWKPDLAFFDSDEPVAMFPERGLRVAVYSSKGDVIWVPSVRARIFCSDEDTDDTLTCTTKIGSWVYSGIEMSLNTAEKGLDLSVLATNKDWELVSATAEADERVYECCPEPYPFILYTFKIRPKA